MRPFFSGYIEETRRALHRRAGTWPFKRQTGTNATASPAAETVIVIPGYWNDIDDLINAIFTGSNGEYMVVGEMLLSLKRERHYRFQVGDRDDVMVESFRRLGKTTRISEEVAELIERHNFVVRISGETGSLKEAENIAFAGAAILQAGGMGLRIDTAGKAFESGKWLSMLKTFEEADLYQLFVTGSITDKAGSVWSCGMHNLGLKDTIISGEDFQAAVDLISIFAYYQVFDKPLIIPGQTFQPSLQSPVYRITDEANPPYQNSGSFENPYGMWRLTRV